MPQVIVGTKYQVVIPKKVREKIKGLIPGIKVVVRPVDKDTITIKKLKKGWVGRTYGMMKGAWKGIEPIVELERMRDEWERKR